jgi:hypothetical protein
MSVKIVLSECLRTRHWRPFRPKKERVTKVRKKLSVIPNTCEALKLFGVINRSGCYSWGMYVKCLK